MKALFFLMCFMSFTLMGCTTMSEKDCRAGNWRTQGLTDGIKGRSQFQSHQKACTKFGISGDKKAYENGFAEGIEKFCTYRNGYEEGLDDRTYHNTCPAALEPDFYKGYSAGKLQRSLDEQEKREKERREREEEER